jgi:hypothetical protein
MSTGAVLYVIDTCAIGDIDGISPATALPMTDAERNQIWEGLDRLIAEGRLVTVRAARDELRRKCPNAFSRLKPWRAKFFLADTPALLTEVSSVLAIWPEQTKKLASTKANRDPADPYIIALARLNHLTIVTNEKPARDRTRRKKDKHIPDICEGLSPPVRWRSLSDFIKDEHLMARDS